MLNLEDLNLKNILLWRHAEAETLAYKQDDMQRALTKKGIGQAKQMALWLERYMPKNTQVLVSPALRTMQTAECLSENYHVVPQLSPENNVENVVKYLASLDAESVMLVGHQPWIGGLASCLLCLNEPYMSFQKGAVWWMRPNKNNQGAYKLYSVQAPQLV